MGALVLESGEGRVAPGLVGQEGALGASLSGVSAEVSWAPGLGVRGADGLTSCGCVFW